MLHRHNVAPSKKYRIIRKEP